jgi:hypothetical protein
MIQFDFEIQHPYPKNNFKAFWNKHATLSKHKALETEIYKDPECIFGLGFRFSFRGHDHAGLRINLGFFTYRFDMHIYDTRHWNHETNSW